MGSLDLLLDQTRLNYQTVQISTMKVLAALTLALAITNVKADGAHSHDHAPAHDSYGPPEPSYEAPTDSYGAPAPSYGAPAPSYSAPSYEPYEVYEEEPLPDLTPIVVAILTLIGLSLLFPTFVQLEDVGGRKKRSAEIIAERTAEIYDHLNEVLEPIDRRCMEKLTCEVGALSYDAGLTSHPFLKLVAPFVPGKYEKYVKHFISANNCQKIKCSTYS